MGADLNMERVKINNLGLIPLAGVCSYEKASKIGYTVDHNVHLLKRYIYIEAQLNQIFAAHIAHVPEWEVKCAAGLHLWLDAEHSTMLRKRVTEMREPPLHLDRVPDERLEAFFQELIRSESTLELMVGIYGVAKRELIRALRKHLAETNPLMDQPTCRVLKFILLEEEEMLAWGEQAIAALARNDEDHLTAGKWQKHLTEFLTAAGGFPGDLALPEEEIATSPRSDGKPYVMKLEPRRDARFIDIYNGSANLNEYSNDEQLPLDERTYALIYRRLREMNVPEWMGPIIYQTKDKPWEYYRDLSRQLWDETRHSMMGEIGLCQDNVPFYKYPIDVRTGLALNTMFEPLEAHILLWYIEQGLMPKKTGKYYEWQVAAASGHEFAKALQDYDWADEVLHAQIGRKWLATEFSSMDELKQRGAKIMDRRNHLEKTKLAVLSEQKPWWQEFLTDIRAGHSKVRERG